MISNRTLNVKRNLIWGAFATVIAILMPFLSKTTIIYVMGIEYEGLNSVFVSIIQVLSITDLGLGTAIIYSLYAPIAKGDDEKVRALLNLYKKCYKLIGLLVLTVGICICPFLDLIIKRDLPHDVNVYLLFFIYLINNIVGYWFYAEKTSILLACQRDDINKKITLFVTIVLNSTQIALLIFFRNYYLFSISFPFFTFIQNYLSNIFVKKMYPQYFCEGEVDKTELLKIKKNVVGMVFQKIGNIILSSIDSIVISSYLGLKILGNYNAYHYVITAIFGFSYVIIRAIIPSVGNSIVVHDKKKNFADFLMFNFIYIWIIIWWSACFLCLIPSFIEIWLGKSLLFSFEITILFTIYLFIFKWMDMIYVYREACGIWWQAKWFPIFASIINLFLNIFLVKIIGVSGVLLSTIICLLFIHDTFGVYVLKKYFFKTEMQLKKYYIEQLCYLIIAIFICSVTFYLSCLVENGSLYVCFFKKILICLFVPNFLLFVLLNKTKRYKTTSIFIKNKIFGKLKKST